jgi:two-component system, NtrC family, sensor kinase
MSCKVYFSSLWIGLTCLLSQYVYGQDQKLADSLAKIYQKGNLRDTAQLKLLADLSFNEVRNLGLALQYAEELISLSLAEGNNVYLSQGYFQKGNKKRLSGDLLEALDAYFKCIDVSAKSGHAAQPAVYSGIADIYGISKKHGDAMAYYKKAIAILRPSKDSIQLASVILNAGEEYRTNNIYDSALLYFNEAKWIYEKKGYTLGIAYATGNIGMVYAGLGKNDLAEENINRAIPLMEKFGVYYPICEYLLSMCDVYLERNDKTAALSNALRSLQIAEQYHLKEQIRDADLKLSNLYELNGNFEKSYGYYRNYIVYRDSVSNLEAVEKMGDMSKNFEVSEKQAEVNSLNQQKKLQRILLILAMIVLTVIFILIVILFRNYRQKQKAYTLLTKANALTNEQRDETNKALEKLKRAQAHLVQSEKLASLGQLTAGIAHEIQNPLNFVTNFSEVNTELIADLQEANRIKDTDTVHAISEEILSNEGKIGHHGKRADAIVKGMLQHSRPGQLEQRLTDINALVDEYFRLAYHGQRAKDKSFNAVMNRDFDPNAGVINIVPQEMSRVILNILNNAFYAVDAKSKTVKGDYSPTVTVSTKKTGDRLFISVKDNGTGISPEVKERIFHPFFTTKGPGVGTGLGLSLSYDIVKAHGGEIIVESEEGVGSEFTIIIPADKGEL